MSCPQTITDENQILYTNTEAESPLVLYQVGCQTGAVWLLMGNGLSPVPILNLTLRGSYVEREQGQSRFFSRIIHPSTHRPTVVV